MARASLVTVLPLTAYALFGGKEAVSLAYTAVSLAALGFTFAIPMLVRRLSRRWAYSLGAALLGLYAILLALDAPPALVLGMFCRTAGAALLNVTLSLYIMDNIGKRDLVRSEPLRLAVATLAWGLAPLIGVRLMQSVGLWAPSALSLAAVALLLAVFWALRLAEGGPIRPASASAPAPVEHPVAAIRRFAAQPRLRLAWSIAFARSAFWTTFFIYVPILMLEGGLGATAGGVAVAAGNLMLLNNLFARSWAERHSLRRVLGATFLAAAALTLAAGLLSLRLPAAAGAAMVAAAFFVAHPRRPRPRPVPARRPRPRARADDRRLPHLPRRLRAAAAARLLLPLHARRLRRRLRRPRPPPRRDRRPHPPPPAARHVTAERAAWRDRNLGVSLASISRSLLSPRDRRGPSWIVRPSAARSGPGSAGWWSRFRRHRGPSWWGSPHRRGGQDDADRGAASHGGGGGRPRHRSFHRRILPDPHANRLRWRGATRASGSSGTAAIPGRTTSRLGTRVLAALKSIGAAGEVRVPSYDRSAFMGQGDRRPESAWPRIRGPLDLVIVEGWMLGFRPRSATLADAQLRVVNECLEAYAAWTALLDALIWLEPTDPGFVLDWRAEAEAEARAEGRAGMTDAEVRAFAADFLPAYQTWLPTLRDLRPGPVLHITIGRDRLPA